MPGPIRPRPTPLTAADILRTTTSQVLAEVARVERPDTRRRLRDSLLHPPAPAAPRPSPPRAVAVDVHGPTLSMDGTGGSVGVEISDDASEVRVRAAAITGQTIGRLVPLTGEIEVTLRRP